MSTSKNTENKIDKLLVGLFTNPTEDGDDYYEPRFTKEEAKQKLLILIEEARIDELERIQKFNAEEGEFGTQELYDRIKQLNQERGSHDQTN